MRKFFIVLTLILLIFLVLGGYYLTGNFSEGTRAGVVQKLSKKGIVIKTWEGQLNLGGFNSTETGGVGATIWDFSVRSKNQQVLKDLETASLSGERVKLYYNEKFVQLFWLGDTKYFVYKVEPFNKK